VALLATDGRLDLDAPVRRYLPQFTLADRGYADSVTVRDLLAHRPGIANRAITFGDAHTGEMTEERYFRLLAGTRPLRSFSYSNVHYTILGRVIEAVSGQSWKEFLRSKIFVPAGMTRTTCSASAFWADENIALPYDFEQGRVVLATPRKIDATMHAAGGIYSTGRDLARWLRLQIGDGVLDGRRVVPAAALRTMRELIAKDAAEPHPLISFEQRLAWGAGWDIRTLDSDTLYCHNGTYAGAGAFTSFLPARNLGVAVVATGPAASVFLAELVAAEAYHAALRRSHEDVMPRLLAMARNRAADDPVASGGSLSLPARRYAGEYRNEDWGTLRMTADRDSLHARIGAYQLPVRLTGADRFVAGDYRGRFETDAAGRVRAVWLHMARPDSVRFDSR
jgi:CubicO group peptidase (beta-lactamase class C family)